MTSGKVKQTIEQLEAESNRNFFLKNNSTEQYTKQRKIVIMQLLRSWSR